MVAIARSRALFPVILAAMILWPSLTLAQAPAQAPSQAKVKPKSGSSAVYVSVHGGWAILHNTEVGPYIPYFDVEPDAEVAFDSGENWGGAIGYLSDKSWRLEFEVAHRSNTFDLVAWNRIDKEGIFPTSGTIKTRSYMVNYVFGDLHSKDDFHVFVGAGLGGAQFELKNVTDSDGVLVSGDDFSIAIQFLVGVEYALTKNVGVSIGYKLFGSVVNTRADDGQPGIGGERVRFPVWWSSFLVGLSYKF